MPIASRRTLPPRTAPRTIGSWALFMWFVALPATAGAIAWRYHFTVILLICGSWLGLVLFGLLLTPLAARRVRRITAHRAGESTCTFARSFDFRGVDTRVIRAVYEEIQPEMEFPIRAGDHLVRDLRLDEEDLALEVIPSIARRLGRSLNGYEANPYYDQSNTVGGLVHFLAAQPVEHANKT